MAQYTITIEGEELEELQQIVADIRKAQPQLNMSEQTYVENTVLGMLRGRLAAHYMQFVQKKTLSELRSLIGSRKDVVDGK